MNAHIIMLASGKGGTGKSTVCALLGAEFAQAGRRVLVVEVNTGLRSLDYVCGVYGKTVYDLGDVLAGRCSVEKAIVESPVYKNLYVMCAPYAGGRISVQAFGAFIARVRTLFDYILLDSASGMGSAFAAASAVSAAALVTVTPDVVAVRDGHLVADALFATGHMQVRLLLNRVPPSLEGSGLADLDECIDTVGAQLIGVLPFSTEMMRASSTGTPLPAGCRAKLAMSAICARMHGREVPLVVY